MAEKDAFRENLERNIVADIVMADDAGSVIRKWREVFGIYQSDLAKKMNVRSSIISDYESGRRKSPGAAVIRNMAEAFVSIGMNGDAVGNMQSTLQDAIIDSGPMRTPKSLTEITTALSGKILSDDSCMKSILPGYVIVDSLRAIVTFSPAEFCEMHGIVSGKAVVFAGAERGRSPLVAIKVAKVRPGAVIFYGISQLDRVAEKIARTEKIPVILSGFKTIDEVAAALRSL